MSRTPTFGLIMRLYLAIRTRRRHNYVGFIRKTLSLSLSGLLLLCFPERARANFQEREASAVELGGSHEGQLEMRMEEALAALFMPVSHYRGSPEDRLRLP